MELKPNDKVTLTIGTTATVVKELGRGQKPLQRVLQICRQITSVLPLSGKMMQETYNYMLNQAVDNYMKDGVLTDDEQQRIDEYVRALGRTTPATILEMR